MLSDVQRFSKMISIEACPQTGIECVRHGRRVDMAKDSRRLMEEPSLNQRPGAGELGEAIGAR